MGSLLTVHLWCPAALLQMMQNMLIEEGNVINVKSANLPKGTYVKLQPHTQVCFASSNTLDGHPL